jgi:cell division septation protein DedD
MKWARKNMLQERLDHDGPQTQGNTGGGGVEHAPVPVPDGLPPRYANHSTRLTLLAAGLILGGACVGLAVRMDDAKLSAGPHQPVTLAERITRVREIGARLDRFDQDLQQLTTVVDRIGRKSTVADTESAGIPAPGNASAADSPDAPTAVAAAVPEPIPPPADDVAVQTGKPPAKSWVVNLISLADEADVERFMREAAANGVNTQAQQVTVNGMTLWRVQVADFSSPDKAEAESARIKEQLGLNEVWIARQ